MVVKKKKPVKKPKPKAKAIGNKATLEAKPKAKRLKQPQT